MSAVRTIEAQEATAASGRPSWVTPKRVRQIAWVVGFILFALFVLPFLLQKGWVPLPSHDANSYWLTVFTSAVIYSLVTLGLGLLIGRVGLVSLCQFMLLSVGAWVAVRFDQLWPWLPYPGVLLIAGVITGLIGTLIGLPALRLSGLYLALITLMAAAALTVFLKIIQFPNGGGGFWGQSQSGGPISQVNRPSIAQGDTAFYRYCVVVAVLMFLVAFWHVKTKPGRAWAAIRQSEATALSAGVRTTVYKLWAFALAAFFTGVAGGLLAAPPGVNTNQFVTQQSIQIYAITLVGGVYTLAGAVVGALVFRLVPELFLRWGIGIELFTIISGVGILQVLLTAPGGLAQQVPHDFGNLGKKIIGGVTGKGKAKAPVAAPPAPAAVPAVEAAESTS
jgi:branched-chain amino acid transport system permease protein